MGEEWGKRGATSGRSTNLSKESPDQTKPKARKASIKMVPVPKRTEWGTK